MNEQNNKPISIVVDCYLCKEHSLHVIGSAENETMQCINCGYATAQKFKGKQEENESYKELTDEMKKWSKYAAGRTWIPSIMTLPTGMIYPDDIDNLVNHKTEMKWKFAPMVDIPEEEQKNYPVEGQQDKFYKRRIDTDNSIVFDEFIEVMVHINKKPEEEKPKQVGIKLPKLKKINGD